MDKELSAAGKAMWRFLSERHAMTVEWEFLHELPHRFKRALIRELEFNPIFEKERETGWARHVVHMIIDSDLSLRGFLRSQAPERRYLLRDLEKKYNVPSEFQQKWILIRRAAKYAAAGSGMLGGGLALRWSQYCEKFRQGKNPNINYATFLSIICGN